MGRPDTKSSPRAPLEQVEAGGTQGPSIRQEQAREAVAGVSRGTVQKEHCLQQARAVRSVIQNELLCQTLRRKKGRIWQEKGRFTQQKCEHEKSSAVIAPRGLTGCDLEAFSPDNMAITVVLAVNLGKGIMTVNSCTFSSPPHDRILGLILSDLSFSTSSALEHVNS
uniref:Uncharacterized protein n=1 Tax=Sphaerodactylus townsendi TaxID=933632 RepID=A0ACB8ET63_9SAUR